MHNWRGNEDDRGEQAVRGTSSLIPRPSSLTVGSQKWARHTCQIGDSRLNEVGRLYLGRQIREVGERLNPSIGRHAFVQSFHNFRSVPLLLYQPGTKSDYILTLGQHVKFSQSLAQMIPMENAKAI